MIELKALKKSFDSFEINIDLKIKKGEIIGILGENGSGKTSLLKMIAGIIKADNGKIYGENTNISMIFQELCLLNNLNVYNNINLPLKIKNIKNDTWINELLSFFDLEKYKKFYPYMLSGGQKQKVAIARALITKPNLILCDEPTSALDANFSKEFCDLILEINKKFNTSILIISHELSTIKRICDRVIILEKGKIIDEITIKKSDDKKINSYIDYIKKELNS